MKCLTLIAFLITCQWGAAQDLSAYEYKNIHIIDSGMMITAAILTNDPAPKIKNNLFYYWFDGHVIHSTQGGYNGQLLNGNYIASYPDKNLKAEGSFKNGLKNGLWKAWDDQGRLTSAVTWSNGERVANHGSVFRNLRFWGKKKPDTTFKAAGKP